MKVRTNDLTENKALIFMQEHFSKKIAGVVLVFSGDGVSIIGRTPMAREIYTFRISPDRVKADYTHTTNKPVYSSILIPIKAVNEALETFFE